MILPSKSLSGMAIFSGNLMSKTGIQLQSQVLLLPWVKKKMKVGIISCSKSRDYSNSVPVRYIPKRSLENKESEASSSPTNGLDDVKTHSSLSSSQTSYSSRSFVPDVKFPNQDKKPINSINYDVGLGRGKVVQANVKRLELSERVETSCSSRSFVADTDFQNQNEKPINNLNEDVGLDTSRVFQSNVPRNELPQNVNTLCSSTSFIVDTESQNQSEMPINSIKYDVGLGTGRVVQSNVQRSELSKSVQTSSNRRKFNVDTEFQNQHKKQINGISNDVSLITGKDFRSNVQRVQLFNNVQTSSSSIIGDNEIQNQYKKRIDYDVGLEEVDGDMQYEGYELTEEVEGFSEDESHENRGIQGVRVKQDVEKLTVELLATRAFTAVELRKKLLGKKFPLGVVDAVIMDFQGRGLINDGLYAETFSRSRWSSSTWGPRRIKKALYSKGVSDVDAEKAIKLVFNDAAASGDQESGLGMSKLSMDYLLAQASKQWQRSSGVSRETKKARLVRWLQYRGFSWSVVSFVLKKLESQTPS